MRSALRRAAVLLLTQLGTALAAEQLVRGRGFVVEDPLPGVNPSRRHITVVALEVRGQQTIVGDPLANGATLTVVANGATPSSQTFVLPAGAFAEPNGPGWSRRASRNGRLVSYSYTDERGENGPVTHLLIRQTRATFRFRATAEGRGNNPEITVLPPDPGTDGGAVFTITGGDTYCLAFGGAAEGRITDNDRELFRVVKPRGRACPVAAP